ncbi:MAG TPA: glycoside hydrolase family 13 protein [Jatrophihabitans sp.]|nr:glycoside hydrolase family 13 protein [Jatrophihabitans sp.]
MTVHHDGSPLYVPVGCPELGDTVPVYVRADASVQRLWVRTAPDREPRFAAAEPVPARAPGAGERWFRAEVHLRNPVTHYRFLLDGPAGYRWLTAAGVVAHDVPDDTDFRLVCGPGAPAWATDAVGYLVFPDRFARASTSPPVRELDLPGWAIPCDWDEPVAGAGPLRSRQFYGGDLDGIAERLDHVRDLGADTLCLTPVFPAPANHRYCASSFEEIDPLLGGDAAFGRLVEAVHRRGLRLVGDLTTNHTGDGHPWFQAARAGADTDLYYFDDTLPDGYETWVGVRRMPKLNWASATLRERFVTAPDSVVRRWLRAGLDGWRIDVANTTGRRQAEDRTWEVAALMRQAMVAEKPDSLLIAENAHDASTDLDRSGWHGTINYAGFTRPAWTWLATNPLPFLGLPVGVPRLPAGAMLATMGAFGARMSWQSLGNCWNGLDSHDTPRFRTLVSGDPRLVEAGVALMMTLPGTPVVYAGDEFGLDGDWGEDARVPVPWHRPERWDAATLACYRGLIRLRRSSPAFTRGGLRILDAGPDRVSYLRETGDEAMLVLVARDGDGGTVRLPFGRQAENVYGGAPDLLPGRGFTVTEATVQAWRVLP